jgi:hypothetical protein
MITSPASRSEAAASPLPDVAPVMTLDLFVSMVLSGQKTYAAVICGSEAKGEEKRWVHFNPITGVFWEGAVSIKSSLCGMIIR